MTGPSSSEPMPHPGYYPGWAWNGYQWVPAPLPMPYSPPTGPYERMRTKATIATVLYALAGGAAIFVIVALLHRVSVVTSVSDAVKNGGIGLDPASADNADNLVNAAVVTYAVAVVLAAISLLVFLHGAQRNNRALGAYDLRYTPGWVVGWSLIPLVNVVAHWLVISDVERTSRDPIGKPTQLARHGQKAFWVVPGLVICFITAFVFQLIGNSNSIDTNSAASASFNDIVDKAHAHDAAFTVVFVIDLVIVGLYALLIRRILGNQERAARAAGVA